MAVQHLVDGSTFMTCDRDGNAAADCDGLFYRDTRHLSHWELRLDAEPLLSLTAELIAYDSAVFYLAEPAGPGQDAPSLGILRRRRLAGGLRETVSLSNNSERERRLTLTLAFEADFAELFEVRDGLPHHRQVSADVRDGEVLLRYEHDGFRRYTRVRAPDAVLNGRCATFHATIPPGGMWSTNVAVLLGCGDPDGDAERDPDGDPDCDRDETNGRDDRPRAAATRPAWLSGPPALDTDWAVLASTYRHSLADLAALRFRPEITGHAALPAAGVPWYMALFGRDSLIASYQALPFIPELCRTTLRALAAWQATEVDDFRDAEPGKILHELRHGEGVFFGEWPQSPYYGACDATPLFLIVLDEYERWTGDTDTVRELELPARQAVEWMRRYGDLDGDGFLEYATRNRRSGMANQCWKDSTTSIVYPDGRLAPLPRATCEIQGYAYDARRRTARLAREVWQDPDLADGLEREAATLRDRFNQAFWLPEQEHYALALDGEKQPVPTLASNMGHLLWSGIVPDERARSVAAHLLGSRLYSGWGVRTLAAGQPVYNPITYHNGSVWPHDNALAAAGLARYGLHREAARVAAGILEAAPHFGYRLPEVFCGEERAHTTVPVPYPGAAAPQAWAAGTPLLLIRVLLGLQPTAAGPRTDPHLPEPIGRLALHGLPGRWGRADAQ